MRQIRVFIYIFGLLLSISAMPLCAADQFIMRAERSYAQEIASRFRLLLQRQIQGHNIFLVQGPEGVAPDDLMEAIRNYDHGDNDDDDDDDDDVEIERNLVVSLPEISSRFPRLIGGTNQVERALRDQTSRNYFGDTVWTSYVVQPAISLVRVRQAQTSFASGAGVVAVIDTGIDAEHPALRSRVVAGYDFIRERPGIPSELDDLDPATRAILSPHTTAILDSLVETNPHTTAILDQDTATRLDPRNLPAGFGHGTMVSGLVHLVAPTAQIMPLKAFGKNGRATLFNIIRAIYFAQKRGAKVTNMSLSIAVASPELQKAVEFVSNRGMICIASAGNQGLERVMYPAGYQEVAGIASTNLADRRSFFSNYGDNSVMLAAPGEQLITPFPGGRYAAGWGTSFSAPLVSGTVALMLQLRPQLTWDKAQDALAEASPTGDSLGAGRLDVYRAVQKASQF